MDNYINKGKIDINKLLELRFQNKTMEQISEQLKCSRSLIGWYLRDIHKNADIQLKEKLDEISKYLTYRTRNKIVNIFNVSKYQLGILWGIGSYVESENLICFRHKERYFLEQIEDLCNFEIYPSNDSFVLKTNLIKIEDLYNLGWSMRNSDQRNIPVLNNLNDYKDFLRAYFELHSCTHWQTTYTRKKDKYYRFSIRIFGNYILMESISNLLNELIEITKKKPQLVHNYKTTYLVYSSYAELEKIFNYLSGEPYFEKYWIEMDNNMINPRRYI